MSRRIALLTAVSFTVGSSAYLIAAILPAISGELDVSASAVGQLVTVFAVGTLGFASGLAAAVVGFLSLNWFFTEPTGSFKIHRTDDVVALAVFAASAALVGWTVQRLSSLRRTALQREAEAKVRLDLTNRLLPGDLPARYSSAPAGPPAQSISPRSASVSPPGQPVDAGGGAARGEP